MQPKTHNGRMWHVYLAVEIAILFAALAAAFIVSLAIGAWDHPRR